MKVTVFVPLDSCSCCYDDFLERFTKIIIPFKQHVEFEVKNGAGTEGDKYDIITNTVMLENGRKFTKLSDFQGFLESTFGAQQSADMIRAHQSSIDVNVFLRKIKKE